MYAPREPNVRMKLEELPGRTSHSLPRAGAHARRFASHWSHAVRTSPPTHDSSALRFLMNLQAQVTTPAPRLIPGHNRATAPAFVLPPLPYPENALEPVISAKTLQLHYRKHHKGYVDTLNRLVSGTPFAEMSLKQLGSSVAGQPELALIFNNAAQTWNHEFYWQSLSPKGGGTPPLAL